MPVVQFKFIVLAVLNIGCQRKNNVCLRRLINTFALKRHLKKAVMPEGSC